MNNSELNKLLQSARVPEPTGDDWQTFPQRVVKAIRQGRRPEVGPLQDVHAHARPTQPGARAWTSLLHSRPGLATLGLGFAAVCLLLGFSLGFWKGRLASSDLPLARVQKYYQETQVLFPNQVQAIIWDQQGPHLVLASEANVPASVPVYLRISGPKTSQTILTFSGQQIRIQGELCEVLLDHRGQVLLVGPHLVWSSAEPAAKTGHYRIEARTLEATS